MLVIKDNNFTDIYFRLLKDLLDSDNMLPLPWIKSSKASIIRLKSIEPIAVEVAMLGASTMVTEPILAITSGKDVMMAKNITPNRASDINLFFEIIWPYCESLKPEQIINTVNSINSE